MIQKKRFLLRLDEKLYESLEQWASNELRSVNAQIEYLLHDAVRKVGRGPSSSDKRDRDTRRRS